MMMKKAVCVFLVLIFTAAGLLLCGCQTRHLIPEEVVIADEVLQLPTLAHVYNEYYLWYKDHDNLSPENIQQGKLLPFGTEVQIVSMTDSAIRFKANGQLFTIRYDQSATLHPVEDFARQLFTTAIAVACGVL